MSYLHDPKIIFTGDFKSDVSTVNNDVRHYDNDTFKKRFQELPKGKVQNGWWNPDGGANFTFVNCTVKKGFLPNGQILSDSQDLVIGQMVSNDTDKPAGKMVDLDPQMQTTSQLWAVTIQITTAEGELLLSGELLPPGFRDLQVRQFPKDDSRFAQQHYKRNRQPLGASWTSVLKNLQWGPKANQSPLLKKLKATTQGNQLSVNLNGFGYYYSHVDGRFTMGKILGTIGPWLENEPELFAPSRRLYGAVGNYFAYSNYHYDEENQRIAVDLGNSYPINGPLGERDIHFPKVKFGVSKNPLPVPPGQQANPPLDLPTGGYFKPTMEDHQIVEIGTLDLSDDPNWLLESGGIVTYDLPKAAQTWMTDHALLLYVEKDDVKTIYAREAYQGLYVRADQNVFRLDPPRAKTSTQFFAYQWGKPLANATIDIQLMPAMHGQGGGPGNDPNPPKAPIPVINIPAEALQYSKSIVTDKNGKATCVLKGLDPGNPRKYIDGQIYLLSYGLKGVDKLDQYSMDWLIVHLRDAYQAKKKPTWLDVVPIWKQFGNLYPIMSKYIVDMSDREALLKRRDILLFAFTRGINEPMYMPVTRDLSAGKMQTLIRWLKDPSVDEKLSPKEMKMVLKQKKYSLPKSLKNKEMDSLSERVAKMSRAKSGDQSALDSF